MIYLLALIALVVVIVLLWKAFGPNTGADTRRVSGPDDDPEFLWKMDRDNFKSRTDRPEKGTPETRD